MKDDFNCWICKDSGMVFYEEVFFNISYSFAYRCSCKRGQISSESIKTVPESFGERMARENLEKYLA